MHTLPHERMSSKFPFFSSLHAHMQIPSLLLRKLKERKSNNKIFQMREKEFYMIESI